MNIKTNNSKKIMSNLYKPITFLLGLSLVVSPQYKAFASDLQKDNKSSYNIEDHLEQEDNYIGVIKDQKVTYFNKSRAKVNILTGSEVSLPKSGVYKANLETTIDGKKVKIPIKKYFPNVNNLETFLKKYNNEDVVLMESVYKTPEGVYTISDIKILLDK